MEKKPNIVYYLGAGASAQSIPMVSQLNDRLLIFLNFLYNSPHDGQPLIRDLNKLISEEKLHFSIDTYARKLSFQQDKENYNKLKALLGCFFLFEQMKKDLSLLGLVPSSYDKEVSSSVFLALDKRYDSFLATILEEYIENKVPRVRLPANISIITWNYDNQFENSLYQFMPSPWNYDPIKFIVPGIEDIPSKAFSYLVRLNGEAYYHKYIKGKDGELYQKLNFGTVLSRDRIPYFFSLYNILCDDRAPHLNFAWETKSKNKILIEFSRKLISQADIIVIIGYSFPYYNMKVDQEIFTAIKNPQIYIQAPKNSIEAITSRLAYCNPGKKQLDIRSITAIDQFFLPPDYFGVSSKNKFTKEDS